MPYYLYPESIGLRGGTLADRRGGIITPLLGLEEQVLSPPNPFRVLLRQGEPVVRPLHPQPDVRRNYLRELVNRGEPEVRPLHPQPDFTLPSIPVSGRIPRVPMRPNGAVSNTHLPDISRQSRN